MVVVRSCKRASFLIRFSFQGSQAVGERKELEYMVGYNKLFMGKELEGRRWKLSGLSGRQLYLQKLF